MQTPTIAALRNDRSRSALTSAQINAGRAAAAAILKCPVVRAIIVGDQANASPASHASHRVAGVTRRTSPYITSAFKTHTARNTTLNDVTMPSHEMSGKARMLRKAV